MTGLRIYLLIFVLWLLGLAISTQAGSVDAGVWLRSWANWDARWYARIWSERYPQDDPRALVFPPGYPVVIGTLSTLLRLDFHMTALLVNAMSYFGSSVIASEVLFRVTRVPRLPVFLFALSAPTSYFVLTAYSDSLFSLGLWTVIYLALFGQSKRSRVAEFAIFASLPWLRLTGYALAAWVLLRRWSGLAVVLSLCGWLGLNHLIAGSPVYFLDAQRLFLMPEGTLLEGLEHSVKALHPLPPISDLSRVTPYLQFALLPLVYFVSIAGVGVWFLWNRHWLLGLTIFSILLVSHNQAFWRSVLRYDLPLYPFLAAALLTPIEHARRRLARLAWAVWFAVIVVGQFLLQVLFANLFRSGKWAF